MFTFLNLALFFPPTYLKRGLFRTANNWYINADANGAANILSKVAATLGINLNGVSRGALTTPLRVHLWTLKNPPTFCLNERSRSVS
ncbi:hypothetical protein [Nostoc sp. MS1]|uniref:hypothetical protein n=1 Tax=Nostoc sp. MS1 TaxID=2764711 RepID=UPI001CC6E62C|nr:hypothetical protein [Nostoc sp. MS1]